MEKKITEKESLDLIVGMIESAKTNIRTSGFSGYILLWGYLVVLAGLTNFIFFGERWATIGWLIMLPIGVTGNIILSRKDSFRKARVYTYTDKIVGNTWLAFGISMAVMFVPIFRLVKPTPTAYLFFYIILLLLAAMALFISGVAYRFKPLKLGAIACWICAIGCFFVPWRYNILLYIIGFVVGYIIPGHMITRKDNRASKNV